MAGKRWSMANKLNFKLPLKKIESKYLKSSFIIEFVVSLVAGISAVFWGVVFSSETMLLDSRIALRNDYLRWVDSPKLNQSRHITLLYLSQNEYVKMGSPEITPRAYLAEAVRQLRKYDVAAIGLDYRFERPDPNIGSTDVMGKEISFAEGDKKLTRAIGESDRVVCGRHKIATFKGMDQVWTPTTERYESAGCRPGVVNIMKDTGAHSTKPVFRRYLFATMEQGKISDSGYYEESFAYALLDQYYAARKNKRLKDIVGLKEIVSDKYLNFYRSQVHRQFYTLSVRDFLQLSYEAPESLRKAFNRDRIVIIGNAVYSKTTKEPMDIHAVPMNQDVGIYGLLVHAMAVYNFLNDDFIVRTPSWGDWLIFLFTFLIAGIVSYSLRMSRVVLAVVVYLICYGVLAYALFIWFSVWIPMVSVFSIVFVTTLLIVILRLARSEKDHLDATHSLQEIVPPQIMKRLLNDGKKSIFDIREDEVIIVAGWSKNLPISHDNLALSQEILSEYGTVLREVFFARGAILNILPQNGFLGFFPLALQQPLTKAEVVEQALQCAEVIQSRIMGLDQYLRHRQSLASDRPPINVDIALLDGGPALYGWFGEHDKKEITLYSDTVKEVMSLPYSFAKDSKSSIVFFDNVKRFLEQRGLSPDRMELTEKTIAGKKVYELMSSQ